MYDRIFYDPFSSGNGPFEVQDTELRRQEVTSGEQRSLTDPKSTARNQVVADIRTLMQSRQKDVAASMRRN
ncbi:hypothetical protein J3A64_001651 [Pseudarthrobacter sp. PvP004]|nr:hypothetical protein [Pseudarthrobacter sp. PvP004]